MKKKLILCMMLTAFLCACDAEESMTTPVVEIVMENENDYYETEDWDLQTLVAEFENMGFTDIETVSLGESSEYTYGPISTVRIDGEGTGWDEGDIYDSDDEVKIKYYKPTPTLTSENCPELAEILSGETQSWLRFAEKYDGQYIEFDGFVQSRLDDQRISDPIIKVSGGDYVEENLGRQQIRLSYLSIDYEVERHVFYGSVGDNLKIIGKVKQEWSEYYDELTIEVVLIEDRFVESKE